MGPARIALQTGAAVVVGTVAPRRGSTGDAGGTEGEWANTHMITATRIPTAGVYARRGQESDIGARARELTERINGELSRRILALPHAWVWMHERWTPGDGVC